ncbi:hypothetical protein JTE90_015102 [Oedothorax gibbosus]|uniref:Orn/DAP/Arg decarboxylase 2 N-terminal domain-containing protein n=1 Tax=Oedothorax gibbosus TaxID=931172 RepID=A0AAV6VSY7_9ARAC|nr:hypothetical protein JTE90_015102 [Oedothorax gibbosus]
MSETNKSNNLEIDGEKFFELILTKSRQKCYSTYNKYIIDAASHLAEDQSFYTIDLADVLWKAQLWKQNFPNVVPYYAVKANSDPVLLRLFVLLGYGFDCSTEGEIRLAIKAGADGKNVIFAHTVKTTKALHYASFIGCDLMTFDSKEELLKIHHHFPKARLILRLKSASTQSVYNLSLKFGCEVSDAEDLLLTAKEMDLNVIGVSFHVGALCEDPKTFTSTIEDCRTVFEMAKKFGYVFTHVDIGAGFFGSKEREGYFYELSEKINKSLDDNFSFLNTDFIAEPGCYYVGSAVSLTTTILGKRNTSKLENENNDIEREYFVNDGFYGSFFEHKEMYDVKPKPVIDAIESSHRPHYLSRVWGQTCCSEDLVYDSCDLPDLEVGDLIVWENMGAYSRGVCSTFTEVPMPTTKHVFVKNNKLSLSWVPNVEALSDYIAVVADLVENEEIVK